MPLLRSVMTARVNEDVLSGKIVTLQSCSFPVYLCACREKCEHPGTTQAGTPHTRSHSVHEVMRSELKVVTV